MTVQMRFHPDFIIIGAGLAGSEAALRLAKEGALVSIWEQKPQRFSAAHRLSGAAELVCSNSFKSLELQSAHGLMKEELRLLGSPLLELALDSRIPGGKALTVDRERFSQLVSEKLRSHPHIQWEEKIATEIPSAELPLLIATGPLSGQELMNSLQKKLGTESLYFYDATAPVVSLESLDLSHFFWGSRREPGSTDYLNLPLSKDEYLEFRENLLQAEKMEAHLPEESLEFFEGCLPIEVLAERGEQTLAYSCMKPIGLNGPANKKMHAVIQLRREKAAAELLSFVGFQTRMKWPEQIRVFRQLPGMKKAEFARLGAMHRNSFINSPLHLNDRLELKSEKGIFFAGQITGGEGYTEAIATGHYAALQMLNKEPLPEHSCLRSLVRYLVQSDPKHFQPMNFNFGLLPPLEEMGDKIKKRLKKADRARGKATRSLEAVQSWCGKNLKSSSTNSWNDKAWSKALARTASEPSNPI